MAPLDDSVSSKMKLLRKNLKKARKIRNLKNIRRVRRIRANQRANLRKTLNTIQKKKTRL